MVICYSTKYSFSYTFTQLKNMISYIETNSNTFRKEIVMNTFSNSAFSNILTRSVCSV